MPIKKDSVKPESNDKADDKKIVIGGDVVGHDIIIGDNNLVTKQTFIQRITNIFKSDAETLEHRNRRILLNHVENAWIKGVLDASLHGAALLDLGIKQDPEAVTKYPWTLKNEPTDETLPAGTSMLEIFDSIGMGRSLLILGAPGSGKTTMLLELARGLIARAREDVTQPIPMVFNLASWTEKLSLADWLAQELNNLYSVPRKTAPDWVKGNKLLLLLDGLDEVRHESRVKCVEAINAFRKEHGLTSLAICSRIEEYSTLKNKLSLEGAITLQPLTSKQVNAYFEHFGKRLDGVKGLLKKDRGLWELIETPLMLSIMVLVYQNNNADELKTSGILEARRKHLLDTYIASMFERSTRKPNSVFTKEQTLGYLSWLARTMIQQNLTTYQIEATQPSWLESGKQRRLYKWVVSLLVWLLFWLLFGLFLGLFFGPVGGLIVGLIVGLILGLLSGLLSGLSEEIEMVDRIKWSRKRTRGGLLVVLISALLGGLSGGLSGVLSGGLLGGLSGGLSVGLMVGLISGLITGLSIEQIEETSFPGQRLKQTRYSAILMILIGGLIGGLMAGLILVLGVALNIMLGGDLSIGLLGGPSVVLSVVLIVTLLGGMSIGLINGFMFGVRTLMQHYTLRCFLTKNGVLPWRLIPFLDHCVDLIFLRRVGGGYIFVHRLLMEHFAEMYVETTI